MSKKKIQVRRATPKDIVNIVKLLKTGWNEQSVEYAPIDDLRGYRWLLGILEEGFIAVADLNGRIVGAACASPFIPAWSTQWMLDMEFLYLLPNFRDGAVQKGLLDAVEGWADTVAKLTMIFGIKTGDRPLVKDRMMNIAGWQYVGGNHLRPFDGQRQEKNDDNAAE